MAAADGLAQELKTTQKFFKKTLGTFAEADSGFAPQEGLFSVAAQVAHTAGTVEWFVEGAFGDGWDMEFDRHIAEAHEATSIAEALAWFDRAFAKAIETVGAASDEELFTPIADAAIMAGAPKAAIVAAITDHTAHHRGALTVYARLLGKEPIMPYM